MIRIENNYTHIATVHEGRIYMRKVVGDIDTLLRETDALNLPGTIGIMHSRPGGDMVTEKGRKITYMYLK